MALNGSPVAMFSAQAANQGVDVSGAIARVLDSHWYVLGREVQAFEREFAQFVGVEHCVSVANGTDALEIALRGLGVGPGDLVATVANAGFYGSIAIHQVGATPLYVDIDDTTLTMSLDSLKEALQSSRPKAIIVTHLYGQLAHIEDICSLADSVGVSVIEDCAQSHGAIQNGKQAGSYGKVACFSFYPTKNLGALGDGGAIVTKDDALSVRLRQLRQYGWSGKYVVSERGGGNSRLDELQAAILRTKLPYLNDWNEARREIALRYGEAFEGLPLNCPVDIGADYVAHLYVVRVEQRDRFRAFLEQYGISTDVHYPVPDHRQPAYSHFSSISLSVTEEACSKVVSLPCYPGLSRPDTERVIEAVSAYFRQ